MGTKQKKQKKPEKKPSSTTSSLETFKLKLTKTQLEHVRDLFSILLPPEAKVTVSQALAECQGRQVIEALLWQKVVKACGEAGVAMDDDAPDFVVAASSSPSIGVFEVSRDGQQGQEDADDVEGNVFRGEAPEGEEEDDDAGDEDDACNDC